MSKRLFGLEGCGIQNVFSMSGYTGHYLLILRLILPYEK